MVLATSITYTRADAESAMQRLAERFGKKTVLYKVIKGKAFVPEDLRGAWVLRECPDGKVTIAEIMTTTVVKLEYPLGEICLAPHEFVLAVQMIIRAVIQYKLERTTGKPQVLRPLERV